MTSAAEDTIVDLLALFSEPPPRCEAIDSDTWVQCTKEATVQITYECACPPQQTCWLCDMHYAVVLNTQNKLQCTHCNEIISGGLRVIK